MIRLVIIIAPENFRDEEYFIPKSILEKSGFNITTASLNTNVAKDKLGRIARVDIDISQIREVDFDGLVFVGGIGATIYQRNNIVDKLIYDFTNKNKLVAAICIAPTILAYSGVIEGKKATVWNGDGEQEKLFEEKKINFISDKNVVV